MGKGVASGDRPASGGCAALLHLSSGDDDGVHLVELCDLFEL